MTARFIRLISTMRRASQLVHFKANGALHTSRAHLSGDNFEGPGVADSDIYRPVTEGGSFLAPIDIDGFADEEATIQSATEQEAHAAKRLPQLYEIPKKRDGIYKFEGIKIIMPQRLLSPQLYRYRLSPIDMKQADDIRICKFDYLRPFPRWVIPLPQATTTNNIIIGSTADLEQQTDYEVGVKNAEHAIQLDKSSADGLEHDVLDNALDAIGAIQNRHENGNKEKNTLTTTDAVVSINGLEAAGVGKGMTLRCQESSNFSVVSAMSSPYSNVAQQSVEPPESTMKNQEVHAYSGQSYTVKHGHGKKPLEIITNDDNGSSSAAGMNSSSSGKV